MPEAHKFLFVPASGIIILLTINRLQLKEG